MRSKKNRVITVLLSLSLVCGVLTGMKPADAKSETLQTAGVVSGMTISTAEDFVQFIAAVNAGNTFADKAVTLEQDITLDSSVVNVVGQNMTFNGILEGRGHTISGIHIEGVEGAYLFNLGEDGEIRNLRITASIFTGTKTAAGLVGTNDGLISSVYVMRSNMTAVTEVGGLALRNNGIIQNCVSISNVLKADRPTSFEEGAGGIAARNKGVIENSCNNSEVSVGGGDASAGGIVGFMENEPTASLYLCYNIGVIKGFDRVGSLGGFVQGGTVSNCYYTIEGFEKRGDMGDMGSGVNFGGCTQMGTTQMLMPDFAELLNSLLTPEDTDLLRWSSNPEYGAVVPDFPGTITDVEPAPEPVKLLTPSKVKAKNTGKKTVTVKWAYPGSASGFEVEVAYKKNFSGKKTYTTTSKKKVVKKLKKKKVFVRVRAFVTEDGAKKYGSYSAVASVKVKK